MTPTLNLPYAVPRIKTKLSLTQDSRPGVRKGLLLPRQHFAKIIQFFRFSEVKVRHRDPVRVC